MPDSYVPQQFILLAISVSNLQTLYLVFSCILNRMAYFISAAALHLFILLLNAKSICYILHIIFKYIILITLSVEVMSKYQDHKYQDKLQQTQDQLSRFHQQLNPQYIFPYCFIIRYFHMGY